MLALTGARLREILDAKWSEIDAERGILFLSDSKTGKKPLYLSAAALTVLAGLSRLVGNPYVIPGAKAGASRVDLHKPWAAVTRAAGLNGLRIHNLRHSFASVGAARSLGLPIIGKLLGHSAAVDDRPLCASCLRSDAPSSRYDRRRDRGGDARRERDHHAAAQVTGRRGPVSGSGGRPTYTLSTDPDRVIVITAIYLWDTVGTAPLQFLDATFSGDNAVKFDFDTLGVIGVVNTRPEQKPNWRKRNEQPDRKLLSAPGGNALRRSRVRWTAPQGYAVPRYGPERRRRGVLPGGNGRMVHVSDDRGPRPAAVDIKPKRSNAGPLARDLRRPPGGDTPAWGAGAAGVGAASPTATA